ncbi:MFS transporter [Pelosinus baikalensis]|uniref:MFS transporter n=1 Tax=Pelosinus baikalensis TaxID=2892015 RepID=A0ABS8HYC2_9FIRM|nr:MFS transporter [Pelosinus baikalensis]MCC5468169.1 MFS transporter [Pelosinus baikalensis]
MNIRGIQITWVQVGVLFIAWLAFLFSFVDRLSWSPVMPIASKELGLSAKEAGSYMTAFYIGYVATQLPGGLLTDKYGYRKVLIGSFLVMGIFTALMGTITSYQQGFIYRVLAGVGSGAIFSACVRAIFDWFPEKCRGTAMGFLITASSLGLSVTNFFVPVLARDHGWQFSFFIAGLLPLGTLVFAWLLLKERTPIEHQAAKTSSDFWQEVFSLTQNRGLMITGLAGFCAMWATWGTATWANTYINKSFNLSLVQVGAVMSTYGAAALLCKPIAGLMHDLLSGKRKYLLFVMLISFGILLLWFGVNKSMQVLYILAPLLGIAAFVYSPVMSTLVGELVSPNLVGTAIGFVNAIWQLGSLISPLAVGAVIDATNNFLYAFAMLAIGPIAGAFIILYIKEPQQAVRLENERQKTA